MDTIPINAIERVEVLRDGASAQYGSDAIAGVINVISSPPTTAGRRPLTSGRPATATASPMAAGEHRTGLRR
ncbi:TonB-dependent receptor plug domain-containing protein [Pseudomonas aeruginosa]|nr:TonB-dependent receptor plug domain-containing protein [Pseudomonas aeruginosa]